MGFKSGPRDIPVGPVPASGDRNCLPLHSNPARQAGEGFLLPLGLGCSFAIKGLAPEAPQREAGMRDAPMRKAAALGLQEPPSLEEETGSSSENPPPQRSGLQSDVHVLGHLRDIHSKEPARQGRRSEPPKRCDFRMQRP